VLRFQIGSQIRNILILDFECLALTSPTRGGRYSSPEDSDRGVCFLFWEMIRENSRILAKEGLGCYELKMYKPWFDEGYSKSQDQW
jgi:hypothetical protein